MTSLHSLTGDCFAVIAFDSLCTTFQTITLVWFGVCERPTTQLIFALDTSRNCIFCSYIHIACENHITRILAKRTQKAKRQIKSLRGNVYNSCKHTLYGVYEIYTILMRGSASSYLPNKNWSIGTSTIRYQCHWRHSSKLDGFCTSFSACVCLDISFDIYEVILSARVHGSLLFQRKGNWKYLDYTILSFGTH